MWEKIKKILQKEEGQCIIMEEGQPTYLIKKIEETEDIEGVNHDIERIRNEDNQVPEIVEEENQEVKVEDLPF